MECIYKFFSKCQFFCKWCEFTFLNYKIICKKNQNDIWLWLLLASFEWLGTFSIFKLKFSGCKYATSWCKVSHTSIKPYLPIFSFKIVSRFWSAFKIVNFWSCPIPSGNVSITFWDKCKSVSFSSPPISSGKSSKRFSETSKQTKFFKFPISCKKSKR